MVLIYLMTSSLPNNMEEITSLKQSLHQKFAINDLGKLYYLLGIKMATSYKGLFFNPRKYMLDLHKEADRLDYK